MSSLTFRGKVGWRTPFLLGLLDLDLGPLTSIVAPSKARPNTYLNSGLLSPLCGLTL